MSEYNYERELGLVYAAQLDRAAESLQSVHPMGKVKHICRLEVARAVEDIVADLAALRVEVRKLRDAWPRYSGKCVYKWGNFGWVVHDTPGLHPTRDEAINVAAGITQAADAAKEQA